MRHLAAAFRTCRVSLILHVVRSSWHWPSSASSPPRSLPAWCCGPCPATCASGAGAGRSSQRGPASRRRSPCSSHCTAPSPASKRIWPPSSRRITPSTKFSSAPARPTTPVSQTARRVAARYPQHPGQVSLHRRPAGLHQRQSRLHGADGGRGRARDSRHQRQRRARDAGLSARRGPALCRPARRRHVLPLSRRGGRRRPVGAA